MPHSGPCYLLACLPACADKVKSRDHPKPNIHPKNAATATPNIHPKNVATPAPKPAPKTSRHPPNIHPERSLLFSFQREREEGKREGKGMCRPETGEGHAREGTRGLALLSLACLHARLPPSLFGLKERRENLGEGGKGARWPALPCLATAPTLHVPPCLPASLSLALLTKKEWEGVGEGGKDESASLPPPSLPPAPSPPPLSLCPYRKKEKGRGSARVRESESKGREGQGAGCGWHCPARA